MRKFVLALSLVFLSCGSQAAVVILQNGDRVSGEVVETTENYLKVKTVLLGEINIDQKFIVRVAADGEEEVPVVAAVVESAPAPVVEQVSAPVAVVEPAPKVWDNKLTMGYQVTNGNTKNSRAYAALDTKYKKEQNEWAIHSEWVYASDKGKMTTQKFYSKALSDYRLKDSQWFNRRSVEFTHDRFSNIDYRITPALGMGYWFWEGDDSKFEADLGLGYEYTNYRDATKSEGNFVAIPHLYIDKKLGKAMKISEDLTMYPSLENAADYRLRSETALINPISDTLSLKLSYIDDFNSNPKGSAKKNDSIFMTSLEYAF